MLPLGYEVCRLIPALSLLKDGKMYGQLQRSFYDNVRACFETKEGAAGMCIMNYDNRESNDGYLYNMPEYWL